MAPVLGGAAHLRDDYHAYRHTTEVDYGRPTTVHLSDGTSGTTYASRTVETPWGTLAEGVLTGAAKRAGGAFAVALLVYSVAWQVGSPSRRRTVA